MAEPLTTFPRHESSARRYVIAYVALLVLTALTYGLSRIQLGSGNLPVVIGIATAKSLTVLFAFMHLLEERGTARLAMVVAMVMLVVLILFGIGDVALRFPLAVESDAVQPTPTATTAVPDNPAVPAF